MTGQLNDRYSPRPGIVLGFIFLFLAPCGTWSQTFVRETYSVPITANGRLLEHPFTGGLYNPMHQFADIDADGDRDLFLFDPTDGSFSFFRNVGTATNPQFLYERDPFPVPEPFGWFRFVDIDGDNKLDLLTSTISGSALTVFLNSGSLQNPAFTLLTPALLDSAGDIVYSENFSIAACVDMDADHDPDFMSLNTSIGTINYYENIGDSANFLLAFRTNRYQDIQICIGCADAPGAHGNGSMHFSDIDNDGDFDMFYGDFFHSGLYFFQNNGTPEDANLDSVTAWFPQDDPVITAGYNQPTLVDIDGDGDNDLFVSVVSSLVRGDNFRFYRNTGTPGLYQFALASLNYIETLDVDLQSAPVFVDIDSDGDQDLFVGNLDGRVAFLRNTGTDSSPAFLLEDSTFVSSSTSYVYTPRFADIDADGDQDMFLGNFSGKIEFYRNAGTPQDPTYVAELWQFDTLSVGSYCAPSFLDVDGDGDLDLFAGKSLGTISYYRNDGTSQLPRFVLETTSYQGIIVGGNSKPVFVDEDGDGDPDMIVGAGDGKLHLYRNEGPVGNPSFVSVTDRFAAIDTLHECAPAMADIDGDGDLDLIVGCQRGGLEFYRNVGPTSVPSDGPVGLPQQFTLFQNYPNPFNPRTKITYAVNSRQSIVLKIYDLLGREVAVLARGVREPGTYEMVWDASDKPSGIYVYELQVAPLTSAVSGTLPKRTILRKKMILLK